MKVFVPEGFPRGGLPDDIIFVGEDPEASFAVPTSSEAAEALGGMPDLQVVQVLSAGIDWVEPHVPDGAVQRRRRPLARRGAVGGGRDPP
jgi:hypothetical protein